MTVEIVQPGQPVNVTKAAVQHFREQIRTGGAAGIRLRVKESGCTGYMYVLDLAESKPQDDLEIELADDVRLFLDTGSLPILRGVTVDFTTEGLNRVLKFINPNADIYCGCGESFSISKEAG